MATIVDVAQEAEVSVATVSRVMNNSFRVTEEKRRRVYAAIEKLSYQPTIRQKNVKNTGRIILLVAPILVNELFDSIMATGKDMGYETIIYYIGEDAEGYNSLIDLMKMFPPGLICGLIFVNNVCGEPEPWARLQQYPLVQVGEYLDAETCFAVSTDDVKAAFDMTSYMIQKGHRRIALVSTDANQGSRFRFCKDREAGYRMALAQNNMPVDPELLIYTDYTVEGGAEAARKLIGLEQKPDAVFCVSDHMGVGCVEEFQLAGYHVPGDIAVAGFDNLELSEMCRPRLTTLAQSLEEIGAEAVRVLDMIVNGKLTAGRKIYVQHHIIVREST